MLLVEFIKEINLRHGLNLTLEEVCQNVKSNLQSLDVSTEMLTQIVNAIDYFGQHENSLNQCDYNHLKMKHHHGKDKINKGGWPGLLPFVVGLVEAGAGAAIWRQSPAPKGSRIVTIWLKKTYIWFFRRACF